MILGVNGIRLLGKRTGVGRCIEAILHCLGELKHPFTEIRVYTPEPLQEDVLLPACARNVVLGSRLPRGLWEQLILPAAHDGGSLLLCPSYVIPVGARCPTFLIHHGSYEGYPQAFSWWSLNKARAIYALSAKRADSICTVSEHSKRDMARFYGIEPGKIHVVPDGVDTKLFRPITDDKLLAEWRAGLFSSDVPCVIYVGKPTKRRNLPSLIKAFTLLKREKGIPHKLLLVGVEPHEVPLEAATEPHLDDEVFTLGFISHEEMALAYNASALLVYPSSYEGFGMPVLEAMACGTPAIALNTCAFPEFAGGIAHLVKDAEVVTLKEAIDAVLSNPTLRAKISKTGPERAAGYDWHLITERYIELMTRVVTS